MSAGRKIHFIANGIFSTNIAGGDMVFFNLVRAAALGGYDINFFGGHAFRQVIAAQNLPGSVTLTDDGPLPQIQRGLRGQLALFHDFWGRYRRTLKQLNVIGPGDFVCTESDYWFDVIPAARCVSPHKLMILNMEAPSLGQIIARSRPDVDVMRLASLHHWAGQAWSLRQFAKCPGKHVFYVHPLMEPFLDRLGINAGHRTWISCGIDSVSADAAPEQNKVYDIVWVGRIHRQKGVDDLLDTLQFLAPRLENFRALIIGNVQEQLRPEIEKRGLAKCVEFSGYIKEAKEKFQLLKKSRVFLMPSHYESWGIVIGEALESNVPVIAYDLPCYRPIFGDLVRYAPPFDSSAFKKLAEEEVLKIRAGRNELNQAWLAHFKRQNSYEAMQQIFLNTLKKLSNGQETKIVAPA